MPRSSLFLAAFILMLGCNQPVQSQRAVTDGQDTVEPQTVQAANETIWQGRQTAITRAVEVASPAIVSINVTEVREVRRRSPFAGDPFFEQFFRRPSYRQQVQSVGSGFIMSPDGYIVTNDHVAGNALKITVALQDGKTLEGELVGTDPYTDLALIKVTPDKPLPYLSFSQEAPLVGEWAIALGNPFGLFEAAEPSVTVGVVSAVGRDFAPMNDGRVYRDMIQTDAAINRGNSGGPLVNAVGEVLGVNTFIYTQQGGGSIGIGFAVPSNKVQGIISELRENGAVDRSYYTGLYVRDLDRRFAIALELNSTDGVVVQNLDDDSPASTSGFRPYDVITSVNGEPITNSNDLSGRLIDFRPGDDVRFGVIRDGEALELTLRLARQTG
ncbi:MAG: trypsin-like peptidase domain-containing protein [Bacteroidota bacterium]